MTTIVKMLNFSFMKINENIDCEVAATLYRLEIDCQINNDYDKMI